MEIEKCEILITGGAGFVGSNLCKRLVEMRAKRVVSIDNYFTGTIRNHVDNVEYIMGSTEKIGELVAGNFNLVFHLGEYSRVEQSFEDVDLVWKYNRNGTLEVIKFCLENGCKLIYAGSSTKYGDGGLGRSQSPYAWSKASNTELVKNYGEWFGLEYAITYFYNVYGDNEIDEGDYATLIGLFTRRSMCNLPLQVVKPGHQRRNFTHIEDIVNGLILIGALGFGDDYGIGVAESYSILEVAEMFGGNIEFLPERRGNRTSSEVVTEKTRSLGWKPRHNLPDFVKNKKKWFKKQHARR
ncbi:MAG: ADP-L-glycero-D-manno-heptose-6-epimerase [Flavobacteriaceae bacterium]|nr:ADP-L-glycero-D-manno-heptose-6-epimerase [Flavobacteriaceae bacterium]|tara:strand:- start:3646 stop:4536 length:891 start_codon:yes stop_codon:yes gene_type:complete